MKYDVYHALHEEANNGWIWFTTPELASRSLVKVKNPVNGRTVYCACRMLEDLDVRYYNEETHGSRTINAEVYRDVLIINDWYRKALDVKAAAGADLEITSSSDGFWPGLRAGCQHPDPVVRLATRLGVLGTWLGISGLTLALVPAIEKWQPMCADLTVVAVVLSVLLGLIGVWACRGVKF